MLEEITVQVMLMLPKKLYSYSPNNIPVLVQKFNLIRDSIYAELATDWNANAALKKTPS